MWESVLDVGENEERCGKVFWGVRKVRGDLGGVRKGDRVWREVWGCVRKCVGVWGRCGKRVGVGVGKCARVWGNVGGGVGKCWGRCGGEEVL